MLQVYTGDGKGKTTAALGQAVRFIGTGKRVAFVQFMKSWDTGERHVPLPRFSIAHFGSGQWVVGKPSAKDLSEAAKAMEFARKALSTVDVLVLDEGNMALHFGLVKKKDFEALLDAAKPKEVIVTGRRAPKWLIARADLVTEMREVKHPYAKGKLGRKGTEY
jgi:cob(I)alamin adenosyltransferase